MLELHVPGFKTLDEVTLAVKQVIMDGRAGENEDTIHRLAAIRRHQLPPRNNNQKKVSARQKPTKDFAYPHPAKNPNCSDIQCYGIDAHYNTLRLQKAHQTLQKWIKLDLLEKVMRSDDFISLVPNSEDEQVVAALLGRKRHFL
mmetsp:Transcript_25513/g.39525  ORF Transcript_25513/g.39525 Transcript_25513/m.39525 type:complete len:144 (-) Transcript_25513:5-436(-)